MRGKKITKQNNSFVQFVIDQMQDAGNISCKSMFGGYTVYCNKKIVALICNNQLFVKPTEKGRRVIGIAKEAPPYPGAKPCFLIQDNIDDKEWMCKLIRQTAEELPIPKQKTKPKKKKSR
ncbi:MAG: TfoX/Sxy family protein [Bacteroidota bacterium]|jgi:TfoX/Sxy family transcriptional regulator of competence genes